MSAISAKALNSTLGTENFKGLDQLLNENHWLISSETTILRDFTGNSAIYLYSNDTDIFEFTIGINGMVKIELIISLSSYDQRCNIDLIEKNTNKNVYGQHNIKRSDSSDIPFSFDVNVRAGNTYVLMGKQTATDSQGTRGFVHSAKLKADILNGKPFLD